VAWISREGGWGLMVRGLHRTTSQPVRMKMMGERGAARAEMRLNCGPDSRLRQTKMNADSAWRKTHGESGRASRSAMARIAFGFEPMIV
jgi:hypothetical protein